MKYLAIVPHGIAERNYDTRRFDEPDLSTEGGQQMADIGKKLQDLIGDQKAFLLFASSKRVIKSSAFHLKEVLGDGGGLDANEFDPKKVLPFSWRCDMLVLVCFPAEVNDLAIRFARHMWGNGHPDSDLPSVENGEACVIDTQQQKFIHVKVKN
jgi:hypothetical protein